MGLYISNEDVKLRVRGKVRVKDNPEEDDGAMPTQLLSQLIAEAESDVEIDLSERYHAPFSTRSDGDFSLLPERPTKQYLRSLCILKSVIKVLETDFGSGAIDADDYVKRLQSRYDKMLQKQMKRRNDDEDHNQFLFPPLLELKLSYHNSEGDDGFRGMVINTSDYSPYASDQINDPSQGFFNATIDDLWNDI